MKKQFGEYYLGLDIGTDSVGWAVSDLSYNQLKLNGKALWGVRLFDAGQTAADRRLARCARRRNDRKKQRAAYYGAQPAVRVVQPPYGVGWVWWLVEPSARVSL